MDKVSITENRKVFLQGLRENPKGFSRITGKLANGGKGRCAIGAGCEYLGIKVYPEDYIGSNNAVYAQFAEALGIAEAKEVYFLNDTRRLSYSEVADEMAERWGMA